MLNSQAHDITILVTAKLLKPLGNPPQNGVKYFATKEVLEHVQEEKWLHRVTVAIYLHWQKRNARKQGHAQTEGEFVIASPRV